MCFVYIALKLNISLAIEDLILNGDKALNVMQFVLVYKAFIMASNPPLECPIMVTSMPRWLLTND